MHNKYLLFTPLGLLIVTVLVGVFLNSSNTNATSTTATATVKVAASCTLTTTGGGNYSATVPNGTSAEIAGSTMSVSCNDAGGFALYAVGYSDDTIGNNNMIGTSTNIPTNTSGTNSYWAMKINPTSGTTPTIENSFNNYHIVPDIHTKIASYASSTGTGSLSVNATYKANISSTQLAGNYLGKVKYTLIHPAAGPAPVAPLAASDCPANSICYAPNADDIEGTMLAEEFESMPTSIIAGRQADVVAGSSATLSAYNYSRPSYGFAGWSPEYDAQANSSEIIYGPEATISTNPNDPDGVDVSTNGLILYPVWVASTGTMQTFTSSNCSSMNSGDVTARTDIRDGETYTIAKLADGKCWMIENLRLNNGANISPTNTQSNNGAFGGVFIGLAKSEIDTFDYDTTANGLYSTDGINAIVGQNVAFRFPRYNNSSTNRSLRISLKKLKEFQWYGYGNYYSWAAAIADTSHYDTKDQVVSNTSICPSGWRLPTEGSKTNIENSKNDYYSLGIAIGLMQPNNYSSSDYPMWKDDNNTEGSDASKRFRDYPNNFVYSGSTCIAENPSTGTTEGLICSRTTSGTYWSNTAMDPYDAYKFSLGQTRVAPTSTGGYYFYNKYDGYSVRCITSN